MKPGAFEYHRPESVGEAVDLLHRYPGDTKILAGGQSLVPLMNFRLAEPQRLIDVGGLDELSHVSVENGTLRIGAMVRQSAIEDSRLLAEKCPLLVEATRFIGHRPIRNRGTIGGSLAHADPAAEYPAALVALEGEVRATGPTRTRTIPASDLFLTFCTTTLAADELLTEVRIPIPSRRTGYAFAELTRRHGDFAVVGVAVIVSVDERGVCDDCRIALAGVGQTPLRCREAENLLKWNEPNPELIQDVCERCTASADPLDDLHASASYRRAMVGVFVGRALRTALERVRRSEYDA